MASAGELRIEVDTAPAERSLAALADRFAKLGGAAEGAAGALRKLEAYLPEDPVPPLPPLPPRKLLKKPDARKRRRQIVRASRRANR